MHRQKQRSAKVVAQNGASTPTFAGLPKASGALATHEAAARKPDPQAGQIFISYAAPDYREANAVCSYLEGKGHKVWIAPRDIPKGVAHSSTIPDAIKDSTGVVALLSDATNQSQYVALELDYSVSQAKNIVPVRLLDVTPSRQLRFLLGPFQWIEAFRHPTDVWRQQMLDALSSAPSVAAKSETIHRDIALSPALLLAAFVAILGTVVASFLDVSNWRGTAECADASISCYLGSKYLLSLAAIGLLAAAALVPTVVTGRYRWRTMELRDAIVFAVVGVGLLLGVLIPVFSVVIVSLTLLISYFAGLRAWLNTRRALWLTALVAVLNVPISFVIDSAIKSNSEQNGAALVLFQGLRDNGKDGSQVDYAVFGAVRDALAMSIREMAASPSQVTQDQFQKIRRINPSRDVGSLFQRATYFEFKPFRVVLQADVIVKPQCGKQVATVSVDASRFEMGQALTLTQGHLFRWSPWWTRFNQQVELTNDGQLTKPALLRAMIAAHVTLWLTSLTEGEAAKDPAPLSSEAVARAVDNVIEDMLVQTQDVPCSEEDLDPICVKARSPTYADRVQLLKDLFQKARNTSPSVARSDTELACMKANVRHATLAARPLAFAVPTGEATPTDAPPAEAPDTAPPEAVAPDPIAPEPAALDAGTPPAAPEITGSAVDAFDSQLHPDVLAASRLARSASARAVQAATVARQWQTNARAAAERAKTAAVGAQAAATRARSLAERARAAAEKAKAAAEMARNGADGYRVVQLAGNQRYEGQDPSVIMGTRLGVQIFPNGDRYKGEYRNGRPDGVGVWTHGRGRYEGEWRADTRIAGVDIFASGERREGEYRNDRWEGLGVYQFAGGDRYEGEYRNSTGNGFGVRIYANGERYEGQISEGAADGAGVYVLLRNNRYEGAMRKGQASGFGVYLAAAGERYEGAYLDWKQHGDGVYAFPVGHRYEGENRDSKYQGYGVFRFPNGARQEGAYSGDKRNGYGVAFDATGRIVQQGIYENDLLKTPLTGSNGVASAGGADGFAEGRRLTNEPTHMLLVAKAPFPRLSGVGSHLSMKADADRTATTITTPAAGGT